MPYEIAGIDVHKRMLHLTNETQGMLSAPARRRTDAL